MYDSLQPGGLKPAKLLSPWDSAGKDTGVGCHALLQGLFPTQESNLCLHGSCIAGRFFTDEPPGKTISHYSITRK